jgi:nitric oxide reductase subunit C
MTLRSKVFAYGITCLCFLILSLRIYLMPVLDKGETKNENAQAGKLLWQQNNCSACHQIYGLGGYLGPDLTNFAGNKAVSKEQFKGILTGGNKQMPAYSLSETEVEQLFTFLQKLDKTGNADPRSFTILKSGMITNDKQ